VAHGLPQGAQVQELRALGQAADLSQGCDLAARHLGADPGAVLRFVRSWDEEALSSDSLRRQLEEVWGERLADAEAAQALLRGGPSANDNGRAPGRRARPPHLVS
jgi:hypothetical protein